MKNLKQNLKQLLNDLCDVVGVSGNEQEIIQKIVEQIKPYADEVKVDPVGNVIAVKKGAKPGPSLLIGAHSDEIGFCVKAILENGYLLIDKIGNVPDNIMLGRKVWVTAEKIPGVIGTKPGHLQTPEEAAKVSSVNQCYIDLGLSSKTEVEDLGIKIGDPIVIQSDFMEMTNPDIICTKAVDNRMGCSIIIELFKHLNSEDFGGTIYGVFTVREEVGLYGAQTVGHLLQPDYAIALDTIPAGDTPDINTTRQLPIFLGKGPGFPVADNVGYLFFSFVHPAIREIIEEQAKKLNINLQTCTILGATYTTDASKYSYAGNGIPCATLAIPRRYSHSPIELVNINDAVDVLKILHAIVINNDKANITFI